MYFCALDVSPLLKHSDTHHLHKVTSVQSYDTGGSLCACRISYVYSEFIYRYFYAHIS